MPEDLQANQVHPCPRRTTGTYAQGPGFHWIFAGALTFFLLLFAFVPKTQAKAVAAEEYEIKAAFLYNFAKFVEWPAEAFEDEAVLHICVVGDNPFGDAINELNGQVVGNRKIVVHHQVEELRELKGCHLLFISRSERGRLTTILNALRGEHVLTIGDTEGFAERGVIINFYQDQNRVRFEINRDAAQKAGLNINAKLLNLAKIVR